MVKYKGQALAIVLVVLIVGIIVAFGIASRTTKNTIQNIEEKKSQDASEVVSSTIDVSRSILSNEIMNNCAANFNNNTDCCIKLTNSGISSMNFSNIPDASNFPKCTFSTNPEDFTKICFSPEYNVEDYTIKKDEVLDLAFITQSTTTNMCSKLDFTFTKIGTNNSGVVISKIYAKRDAFRNPLEFKPFESSDITNLLLGSNNTVWGNWNTWNSTSGTWTLNNSEFTKTVNSVIYPLDDMRIRAVGSDLKVNMVADRCTMSPFFIKVTTTANCGGNSKASYYYRPLRNSALSLFDFVIYNKNGNLEFKN